MAPAYVSLRALLAASFDVHELREEAERLGVDDLRALGSFAAQPHPLVHRVAVAALALLLSLAPSHVDAGGSMLHVRPWAVLRLELLADSPALWRRLRARARQLETGNLVLSPTQIRFVCQELLRFLFVQPLKAVNRSRRGEELEFVLSLEPVARVSTIAAALGAWTCLCLHHACEGARGAAAPASSIKILLTGSEDSTWVRGQRMVDARNEKAAHNHLPVGEGVVTTLSTDCDRKMTKERHKIEEQRDHRPLPMTRTDPLARSHQAQPPLGCGARTCISRRVALKVGGRYVLFHARINPQSVSATWSLLALDANWNRSDRRSDTRSSQPWQRTFWIPFRPLEFRPVLGGIAAGYLSLLRLPRMALDAVLIQLTCRAGMLRPRNAATASPMLVKAESIRSLTVLHSHFIVVNHNSPTSALPTQCVWCITAIGRVAFPLGMSVAALRLEMVATLTRECSPPRRSTQERQCPWSDLQFLYRGALLPRQFEDLTSAAALLPIAMLLLPPNSWQSHQARGAFKASTPLRLQRDVAEQLLNCGLPSHSQHDPAESKVEAIAIHQAVSTGSSRDQSTASSVTEILRNWESFVQLQHLQDDSTVVFQLSPDKHSKKSPVAKRRPLDAFLASHEDNEDCKPKDTTPQLPQKKFNPQKEYLLPLYATAEVVSSSKALLSTPFTRQLLLDQIKPRARLALMDEFHVMYVQATTNSAQCGGDQLTNGTEQRDGVDRADTNGNQGYRDHTSDESRVEITFERDRSCPPDYLEELRGAYVWQIVPRARTRGTEDLDSKHAGLSQRDPSRSDKWPPRWLCAVYRYVTHPMLECGYTRSFHRFRVCIIERYVENAVEATFWSKGVDWEPYLHSTDIQELLLRKCYELLCHSHPPSIAVDSVKFSKLLRECGVQPKFLTVGDAAYLFASHLATGSHYEMVFDGFERALERIAHIIYGQRQQQQLPPLRQLCFDRLVHAPSLLTIWQDVVNAWRLAEKRKRMQAFADEYCAATRIRALWKQVATRRVHIRALGRMKAERHAATKIQSAFRMRVVRVRFSHLRWTAVRLQKRIKARAQLRFLRQERAAFVERMRVRLVRWMKSRLRVLRAWKHLNALWVARRDRIWQKRQRMVAATAYYLETRCYRFYLYRPKPADLAPTASAETGRSQNDADNAKVYELEIVDSRRSSCVVVSLTREQVATFEADERRRLDSPLSFFSADRRATVASKLTALDAEHYAAAQSTGSTNCNAMQGTRPELRLRRAKPRPSATLEAIVGRLRHAGRTTDSPFYARAMPTSLGKRLFFGAVQCDHQDVQGETSSGSRLHIVKLLQRADTFTMTVFTSSTATTRRFDVTTAFVFRVLQCMQFPGLSLLPPPQTNPQLDQSDKLHDQSAGNTLLRVVQILRGPWRLQALRSITSYVTACGTKEPSYAMMPEVKAAKQRAREEERRQIEAEALALKTARIVRVQSRTRQLLARRARQQLALRSYRKTFDRHKKKFVYIVASNERDEVVQYDSKPSSLFDSDVPLPADKWEPVVDPTTTRALHYANDYRGSVSRFNDQQAARAIQRWFRRLMWVAIKPWEFRQLVAALQFHQSVEKPSQTQPTTLGADAHALENAKRYAMQLHALQHDYKGAFAVYEAVLQASPKDAETLTCLAVLLVASCRYPAKQTWVRAQRLLEEADAALAEAGSKLENSLAAVEDSCFCWALFLNPRDPEAIVNYAVFLQCVRREMDKAEMLYRRGLDVAPTNEHLVENYRRLRVHRAPDGLYAFAGPGKVALARAQEFSRHGKWREMEDPESFTASTSRFFHCLQSGECAWTLPDAAAIEDTESQ